MYCGFVGHFLISGAVWGVLFALLGRVDRDVRWALMACLVIATAGEMALSLGWGLYTYRLGNIPLYVPPGHALMLLLGISLAQRMSEATAQVIIVGAAVYSFVAAAAGIDTFALPLFFVLAAASFIMPRQRRLYASTFLLSLVLELYGTWLGSWTWAHEVPGIALVTTNPPGVAGAFYSALDALVAASSLLLARRWNTPSTRPNVAVLVLPRANLLLQWTRGLLGTRR